MANQIHFSGRLLSVFMCACMLITACSDEKAEDEFWIHGKISGLEGKMLWLERLDGDARTALDSFQVGADGTFSVKGKQLGPDVLAQLRSADNKNILLLPGNHDLHVEATYPDFPNATTTGEPLNEQLCTYRKDQVKLYKKYLDSFGRLNSHSRERDLQAWRIAEAETDRALYAYHSFLRAFTDTVQVPILRAIAAMSYKGQEDFYRLEVITQRIAKELPEHPITKALETRVKGQRIKWYSVEVPDFEGTNLDGRTVNFSETKGKVVLFYVWASYCEASRSENKRLRQLLAQKQREDFILVDYSLDDSLGSWKQALAEDSLPSAMHLVSPDGWKCVPVSELAVRSIPFTYLVDHRGIIRSCNLFAEDLDTDLDSLVNKYMNN